MSLGVLPDTALAARAGLGTSSRRGSGPGAQLAVSDEQAGGSTTGAPGEVVALGEVAEI